jgi:transposase
VLAEAIRYTLAQRVGLTRFLEDGHLEPDTNTEERTMRPIAPRRRNSSMTLPYSIGDLPLF